MIDKDLLKEMVSVEEVANQLGLRTKYKSGKMWLECPNHMKNLGKVDKNLTNCVVSQDNKSYYCFGCRSGGDIFTMVMNYLSLSFVDALNWIIDSFGIDKESIAMSEERSEVVKEASYLKPFFEVIGLGTHLPTEFVTQEYGYECDIPTNPPVGTYIKRSIDEADEPNYQKMERIKITPLQLKAEDPEAYNYLVSSKMQEAKEALDEQEKIAKTMVDRVFYENAIANIKKEREIIAFANW
jgi:hypothetical protein